MITGFSNTYIVANEKLNEAIIIDPGKITPRIIEKLESKNFKIQGILITHNHETHVQGLRTLNKIYSTNIRQIKRVKALYFALTFFCLNISKLNTAAALAESKAFLKSLPYSTTIFCLDATVMVELIPLKAPPKHKQKSDSKV